MSEEEFYYLENEEDDPETNWNEILNSCWRQENDDCHALHVIEVEASHDSPLLKFEGITVNYPNYKALDNALGFYTGENALIILILYKMEIVEHERRPEEAKIIGFDGSGCLIFPNSSF
ncbi:MAG: hypothetical protein QXJ72_05610 [Thermoproteota archaeon]